MKRNVMLLLFTAAAVLSIGCGAQITPLAEDPDILRMEAEPGEPISGKAMLAFFDTREVAPNFNAPDPAVEISWVPEIDTESETSELLNVAESLNMFEVLKKTKLLPEETDRESAIREAWERGFDFVLYPTIKQHRVYYSGHTGKHVPNIMLWFLLWAPSWFLDSERYGAYTEMEMSLIDVYSKKDIIRKTYSGKFEKSLDAFDRGWQIFGVWRIPGSLKPENWEKIKGHVLSPAENTMKKEFCADFREGVVKTITESETFLKAVTKTVVLSVGLNEYANPRFSPVAYAAEDATRFFNMLKDDGKALDGYSNLLVNGMGSKADILLSLKELSGRMRESDILVFYYSGYGASVRTEDGTPVPVLVPYDAEPERMLETCITFDEIGGILKGSGIGEAVLIFDTSFSNTIAGKTVVKEGVPVMPDTAEVFGEKTALLSACRSGEPAGVFSELKGGLYSYYLIEAVQSEKGDTNRDGLVTMREAFLYTEARVKATSSFRGRSQKPEWTGRSETRLILRGSEKQNAVDAVMTQLGAETSEEVELK